ncbi:MAG: Histone acetyltransferase and related acetyltransferase, partial [Segetibacter sp.]|nr:Histone acetyltransferase and related acetyltransferase [Segetibacter sp.]
MTSSSVLLLKEKEAGQETFVSFCSDILNISYYVRCDCVLSLSGTIKQSLRRTLIQYFFIHLYLFITIVVKYILIPATNNDFDFVYDLKKIVLKEYVQKTWGSWNEEFQITFHKEHFNITNTKVIKVDDKPIGSVDVKEGETNIFISGLYLLPEYQSKGIGSYIIQDLLKKAESEKKRLELEVLRVNTKAQKLYKRLGFMMEEKDENKFLMYKYFDLILGPSPLGEGGR